MQVRLHELQREAEANRTLYESYLARYKETASQESLEMPKLPRGHKGNCSDPAIISKDEAYFGPRPHAGTWRRLPSAFITDYLDRRVKTLEQLEEISSVPALAAVPLISTRELAGRANRGRATIGHYDPKSVGMLPASLQPPLMRYALDEPGTFFAEAIRAVRLAIQRTIRVQPVKIILVTSALDGDGKTTLAANLAFSMATLGIKTLLIDGDLRNPQLTRSLCPRAQAGLMEVAMGQVSFKQAMLVDHEHRAFHSAIASKMMPVSSLN